VNILVTGGAGYIGSHVVKQLLEKTECDVTIIDNLSTGFLKTVNTLQDIAKLNGRTINFIKADLSNWYEIRKVFEEKLFDAVMHFAASIIVPESVEHPLKYYLNNSANSTNLIDLCIRKNIGKFIFSSTAAVYGNPNAEKSNIDNSELRIAETYPAKPINPYGSGKLMVEKILKDTSFAHPCFKYIILRYFNVAGASMDGKIGQSTLNATHLIKVAAQAALGRRQKISIFGDNYNTPDRTCIRDYIHVDDLASAHIAALNYLENHQSNLFNCGYSHGYSVKEVIAAMKKVSGANFKVEIEDRRAGDPPALISDNSKIINKMAWKAKYDNLELICKTALAWERNLK